MVNEADLSKEELLALLRSSKAELSKIKEDLQAEKKKNEYIEGVNQEFFEDVKQFFVDCGEKAEILTAVNDFPDSRDIEMNIKWLKTWILQALKIKSSYARLRIMHFGKTSEKMGDFPAGDNGSDETPVETTVSFGSYEDEEDETGNGVPAVELSPEDKVSEIANKAIDDVNKIINKSGRRMGTCFEQESHHTSTSSSTAHTCPSQEPRNGTHTAQPKTTGISEQTLKTLNQASSLFDIPTSLDDSSSPCTAFTTDNRHSFEGAHNQDNADASKAKGTITPGVPINLYCPHCQKEQPVESFKSLANGNQLLHIEKLCLDKLWRIAGRAKCKVCGKILNVPLNVNDKGMKYNAITSDEAKLIQAKAKPSENIEAIKVTPNILRDINCTDLKPKDFDFDIAKRFSFVKGGSLTIGAVVMLITMHSMSEMPYSRLIDNLRKDGLAHGTAFDSLRTFSRLIISPMAAMIKQSILQSTVVHMDESPMLVRDRDSEGNKNTNFTCWQISSGILETQHYSWFKIAESRGADTAYSILNEPTRKLRFLCTDGYAGYNKICEKLNIDHHVLCLAHARREVLRALEDAGLKNSFKEIYSKCNRISDFAMQYDLAAKSNTRLQGNNGVLLALFFNINCLFHLEHKSNYNDPNYLKITKQIRQHHSSYFVKNIKQCLDILTSTGVLVSVKAGAKNYKDNGRSPFSKCVVYLQKFFKELTVFVDEPEAPLTNSLAERAFKDFAVIKHSSLFCDSVSGSRAFSDQFTVVRSCMQSGVDVYDYLVWLTFNLYKRWQTQNPTLEIKQLTPLYEPVSNFSVEQLKQYKTRNKVYLNPRGLEGEYVKIDVYDDRYKAPFDNLDLTGLSILDYKQQCLLSSNKYHL